MRVVSLTTIPPRVATLAPTLETLVAQGADAVVLCLPRLFRRFPGPVEPPSLPAGVTLLRCDDHGPATKLLPALRAWPRAHVTVCDDDCLYAPGWLDALTPRGAEAVAGSVWSVTRLRRQGREDGADVAQGFAGLTVTAAMFDDAPFAIPPEAWAVDDLWISGQLARRGVPIRPAPEARARVTPRGTLPGALQHDGRAEANAACADWLHRAYGIWPPRAEARRS